MDEVVLAMCKFGEHYWTKDGVRGDKSAFRNECESDWVGALVAFLRGYAFERAGRSPRYAGAAVSVIERYRPISKNPAKNFSEWVWTRFLKEIEAFPDAKGANKKNNPLAPIGGGQIPITELVLEQESHMFNLSSWVVRGIRDDDAEGVFTRLTKVRGIGRKIASFYMRDISVAFGIHDSKTQPPECFQPIDTWTKRGAKALARRFGWDEPETDSACVSVLTDASTRCSVDARILNTGLWYFGSAFAESADSFETALIKQGGLKQAMETRLAKVRAAIALFGEILGSLE